MYKHLASITLVILLHGLSNAKERSNHEVFSAEVGADKLDSLEKQVDSITIALESERKHSVSLKRWIISLTDENKKLDAQIDSLGIRSVENSSYIKTLEAKLEDQQNLLRAEITESKELTNRSVSELDETISTNTTYWVAAGIILGLLTLVVYYLLRKSVSENQTSVVESIATTRADLEQEGIKLDEKLIGILETQLALIKEDRSSNVSDQRNEPDHSLALKVADEIVRIEKNISQMDEGTKGLKQLSKAVDRIRDNFAANGYEMVEMLGKPYDEGMKVTANFRPDENLETGIRVITRIIKPQVNYKGEMIQSAQIEVSQGE